MPKTIAAHIHELMKQVDRVHYFEGEERIRAITILFGLFKEIQAGRVVVPPLYPREDRLMPIVENYRKCLGPADILDDSLGPFQYQFLGS
jgi:hypothetical protein